LKSCEKEFSILVAAMSGGGESTAGKFLSEIQDLIRGLDFPCKPSDLGIKKEDAQTILEKTLAQKRRLPTNPRFPDDELLSLIEEGI
jgi:alcohol dehydrogenase class IV